MGSSRGYRDLVVWKRGIALVPVIYRLAARFPKHELYALADQLRRASVSIPANIAEGQARRHRKEFLQHLSIARGSLAELNTLLVVAAELGYVDAGELTDLESQLNEIGRPLQGLISRLDGPS